MAQLILTEWNGTAINDTTVYGVIVPQASAGAITARPALRGRANRPPDLDMVEYGERMLPFRVYQVGATHTPEAFEILIGELFKPHDGEATLKATHNATTIQITATVVDLHRVGKRTYDGVFLLRDPAWVHVSEFTDSASPLTVAGNLFALPRITVTPDTSTVRRRRVTITDASGEGLDKYLIQASFDATGAGATTQADYIAFFRGRAVPITVVNPNNAATKVYFRVTVPAGESVTVDIYYGSSVDNTETADTLEAGGLDLDNASFTNTRWYWDDWRISDHPDACGVWRPAKTGGSINGTTYEISAEAAAGVTFKTNSEDNEILSRDADSMVCVLGVPAGTSSALTYDYDSDVAGQNANWFLKYRLPGSSRWVSVFDGSGDTSGPATADIDGATEIAIGVRPTSDAVTASTLAISGTWDCVLDSSKTPTVSVAAAVTARRINSTLTNTTNGDTLTFTDVYMDDEDLVIDCANQTIETETGTPWYGEIVGSDRDYWFTLAVGENAWTEPADTAVAFAWRPRYLFP